MFVRGYRFNITGNTKNFLKQHNSFNFHNRPASYVVKLSPLGVPSELNDKIKIGSCSNLYNRIQTYNNMYRKVDVIHARGFPHDSNTKYHTLFADRLAKINNNSYHHDIRNETTIIKSVKDLVDGKYKILDKDNI